MGDELINGSNAGGDVDVTKTYEMFVFFFQVKITFVVTFRWSE